MRFGRTTLSMSPNTRMSLSWTGIPACPVSLQENLTDTVDGQECLSYCAGLATVAGRSLGLKLKVTWNTRK
jgi:hypothetical protein